MSYSDIPYTMNHCKCEKSYVDLEEGYARCGGEVDIILINEMNEDGQWVNIKKDSDEE